MEDTQEWLWKRIRERETCTRICKEFATRICELENDLDVVQLEEQSSPLEGTKRRRKSMTLDIDDILCLSQEEAREDLRSIMEDGGVCVLVEDDIVHVGGQSFRKGDRVRVTMNNEEFIGTISSVSDGDMVFKTRDYRRLKLLFDDVRSARSSIAKLEDSS